MAVDPARAKSLFLNASDLADPAERAAYLGRECGEDAELRGRVEALLQADDDSPLPSTASEVATIESVSGGPATQATGVYTSNPGAEPSPISITALYDRNPGAEILIAGRYTLLEKIGEGGMGEVWVAKQSEPVKRKVALKLIKPGMDSRAVIQRFEQERQALALMDHTNIAKVLDAGMTPNGQPFFVMELVNGLPLNKFCDEARLTPRQRLELFVPICQAVQHAHQKGIVHRDLKPANILITIIDGKPVPKVIDFGVSKATGGKLTDNSLATQFGAVVGTLEYMSPEQAGFSGVDVDTRADIYSLGVILYELLTGLRPIDASRLKKAALTEMIRIIREEEPSKPSTRLSTDASLPSMAALRQTEPRKLMTLLRGELDWVVMKCLEKNRERRYETANGLAKDIQRYLADETVEARPASAGYRIQKFVSRHKSQVIAAGLVLLTLLGGIVGTTWGLVRARHQERVAIVARAKEADARKRESLRADSEKTERERADREKDRAVRFLDQALAALRATTDEDVEKLLGSKKELSANEREYLEAIARRWQVFAVQSSKDVVSRRYQAEGHSRVANLWMRLGRVEESGAEYRVARDLQKALVDDFPNEPSYRQQLATIHHNLGVMLADLGKSTETRMEYEAALDLRKKLVAQFPDEPSYRFELSQSLHNLAIEHAHRGNEEEARAGFEAARDQAKKLADQFSDNPDYQSNLGQSQLNLGKFLNGSRKPDEARVEFLASRDCQNRLANQFPANAKYRNLLAAAHAELGDLAKSLGKVDEARHELELARDIQKKLVDEYPAVPSHQENLAATANSLGVLFFDQENWDDARVNYQVARDMRKRLAEQFPYLLAYQVNLGGSYCNFGNLTRDSGNPTGSLEWFDRAVTTLEPVFQRDQRSSFVKLYLHNSHLNRALVYDQLERHAEAIKDWNRAIELTTPANEPELRARRALARFNMGNTAEALAEIGELTKSDTWSGDYLYSFASMCSSASERDPQKREEYADVAMLMLRKAMKAGYNKPEKLAIDPNLDPLRHRDDFKKLINSVEGLSPARPLARLRDSDPAIAALDARLSAVIKGDRQPKDNADRLRLGRRAYDKALHATAARLWAEAIAADPNLGDDLMSSHRYNAACAAALAGCGKGKDDPSPDDAARVTLRNQCLDWLAAELKAWNRVSMTVAPGNKDLIVKTLTHWKRDADLAGIRDDVELAKLPEAERATFRGLWADVDGLLAKMQDGK